MFCGRYLALNARALAVSLLAVSAHEKEDVVMDGRFKLVCSEKKISESAIRQCTEMVQRKMTELGCPGMVVGVSVNGKNVWVQGFGYSDIENSVTCKPETVMRIASISKSMTMAAVARLLESGKLDLDKPVQEYVPEFPHKEFNNEKVKITTRMLLSNTSGIRHYEKKDNDKSSAKPKPEFSNSEYLSMKPYKCVTEALDMFKKDTLFHKPGEKYLYTTFGWTLVSAVVEKVCGEEFVPHMKKMFHQLGMDHTFAEYASEIVYCRARHYLRNKKGLLVNVPYVDNSYKWAGGGFISNIPDLLKFGNLMLYSFQYSQDFECCRGLPPGFLKQETVEKMWHPHAKTSKGGKSGYGMGWQVFPEVRDIGFGKEKDFEVLHTGGAIGASSVLYICPGDMADGFKPPKGIIVAILTNLQSVRLTELARKISKEFRLLM